MDRAPPPLKVKRSESLRKMTQEQLASSPLSPRSQLPLKQLIDEVLKHLIDIIEMLLLEENSNNYITFMNKMEQMNQENEKKMLFMIQSKLQQFKNQAAEATPTKIKRTQHLPPSINRQLKSQRKNITQSILSCQRSISHQNLEGQKSAELLKTTSNIRGSYNQMNEQIQQEPNEEKTMVNSMDLHSISARLSEVQQAQGKTLKEMHDSLQAKVEKKMAQLLKDIQGLTQKHINFRLTFQERLQTNLQSLWNVITDIRTQMASQSK